MREAPLLSICIPTFDRPEFLRVMLEALLPQAAALESKVEVWVSDNSSTDATRHVVEHASSLGPVYYSQNATNIGPLGNIVTAATRLATGEYVWILGDHNLIASGGLANVVDAISLHRQRDVFYVNFRCATFPDDWPKSALGGHDGAHHYLGNDSIEDREIGKWSDLVRSGTSALCTQAYAHVVRRNFWTDFWKSRKVDEAYTSGETTYPHTWMIAQKLFASPSFYIGKPILTVFNGAQSWRDPVTRARVAMRGLPGLIELFARQGLPLHRLVEARQFAGQLAYETAVALSSSTDRRPGSRILSMLGMKGIVRYPYLLRYIWRGYVDGRGSRTAQAIGRAEQIMGRFPK
jgi:hypothetical protein